MSIDIDAIMIYGVPYSEIPDDLTEEVDKLLDDEELDYASPYFDSPRSEWIVGVSVYCCGDDLQNTGKALFVAVSKTPEILQKCNLGFYVSSHVT